MLGLRSIGHEITRKTTKRSRKKIQTRLRPRCCPTTHRRGRPACLPVNRGRTHGFAPTPSVFRRPNFLRTSAASRQRPPVVIASPASAAANYSSENGYRHVSGRAAAYSAEVAFGYEGRACVSPRFLIESRIDNATAGRGRPGLSPVTGRGKQRPYYMGLNTRQTERLLPPLCYTSCRTHDEPLEIGGAS